MEFTGVSCFMLRRELLEYVRSEERRVGKEILAPNTSSGNRAALYSAQAKTRDCSTLVDKDC